MKRKIAWALMVLISVIFYPDFFAGLVIAALYILIIWVVILKFYIGTKFRDMPNVFYDVFAHPVKKIVYPIINVILLSMFLGCALLFFAIFIPLIIQFIEFLRYGSWVSLSLNDLLVKLNPNLYVSYFDFAQWKGVAKILNWFFFELNASMAILILFAIYVFFVSLIFNSIDDKTTSKLFDE
tara:strand:- start:317 stop:862 length:546 start_codon:yes stop_codon:yes gene_type:complete